MEKKKLVEVRCPFKVNRYGKLVLCDRLCVKVTPGSQGETRCNSCKLTFQFEIDDDRSMTNIEVQK